MTGSVMTPTAQVVALYAEYDSLLDALEAGTVTVEGKALPRPRSV